MVKCPSTFRKYRIFKHLLWHLNAVSKDWGDATNIKKKQKNKQNNNNMSEGDTEVN
jgi:hypothetical protein